MLISHPLAGPTLRFAITGATVSAIYFGGPLLLNGVVGLPLQVAIPISYVVAVSLHFTLQRVFVFRHVSQFALSKRQQAMRYLAIGSVQYPTTAVLTAVLPGLLHVAPRLVYLGVSAAGSLTVFVLLRSRVFHEDETELDPEQVADLDPRYDEELELLAGRPLGDRRHGEASARP